MKISRTKNAFARQREMTAPTAPRTGRAKLVTRSHVRS